jgi:site-specific recombinase XerD
MTVSAFLDCVDDNDDPERADGKIPAISEIAEEYYEDILTLGHVLRPVQHNIRLFIRWLESEKITQIDDVTARICKSYIRHRQATVSVQTGKNIAPGTIRHECADVKHWMRWCYKQGVNEKSGSSQG